MSKRHKVYVSVWIGTFKIACGCKGGWLCNVYLLQFVTYSAITFVSTLSKYNIVLVFSLLSALICNVNKFKHDIMKKTTKRTIKNMCTK